MINLFSSLPPSMNRFDDKGRNIGQHYYRQCLESWLRYDFKVHSVNSESESPAEFEKDYPVLRLTVKRDARELCGKPLVYFDDFIRIASDRSSNLIAITNADIEFDFSPEDIRNIAELPRGHFICERRKDYEFQYRNDAKPYRPGFDFFVMHREDVQLLRDNQLVFGMPWWDYLVPTALLAQGLIRHCLQPAAPIFHLTHDERWNDLNFMTFGKLFRAELEKVQKSISKTSSFHTAFERLLWIERHNPVFPYPRRTHFLKSLFRS